MGASVVFPWKWGVAPVNGWQHVIEQLGARYPSEEPGDLLNVDTGEFMCALPSWEMAFDEASYICAAADRREGEGMREK